MIQSRIAVAILLAPAAALTAPPARARPRRTALKSIKVTYIEPDAAAEMGVREWPFSDRKDGAEETVPAGAQRYVLKGTGTVECSGLRGRRRRRRAATGRPGVARRVRSSN